MSTKSFLSEVLLRSEQTDGRVSAVENTVPADWEGPPLHHHDFDEASVRSEPENGRLRSGFRRAEEHSDRMNPYPTESKENSQWAKS